MSDLKYRDEGLRLQQARKSLGLTQQQLAGAIGSSLAAVKAYERGKSLPNRRYATELANLGINMGYIFSNDQPMLIPMASRGAHAALVDRVMNEERGHTELNIQGKDGGEAAQRLRAGGQSIMKICGALDYELPMVWVALINELMFIYGLPEDGARRIVETLKGSSESR